MSGYHKFTIITGYDVAEVNPYSAQALRRPPTSQEADKCYAWNDAHRKSVSLRGHWNPEAAYRYAASRGWHRVEMAHYTGDLSGHGRGGQDARVIFDAKGGHSTVSVW